MRMNITSKRIKLLGKLFIEKGQIELGLKQLADWGGAYDQRAELHDALRTAYTIRLAHVEKMIRETYSD